MHSVSLIYQIVQICVHELCYEKPHVWNSLSQRTTQRVLIKNINVAAETDRHNMPNPRYSWFSGPARWRQTLKTLRNNRNVSKLEVLLESQVEVKQGCVFGSTKTGVKGAQRNAVWTATTAALDEQTCCCPAVTRVRAVEAAPLLCITMKQKTFPLTKSLLNKKKGN